MPKPPSQTDPPIGGRLARTILDPGAICCLEVPAEQARLKERSWIPAPFAALKCPLRQILVASYNHHTGASVLLPELRAHIPSLACLPKVPCFRAYPFNNRRAKAGCRRHSP